MKNFYLISISCLTILLVGYSVYIQRHYKGNYFYGVSLDIRHHAIGNTDSNAPKIILLGSSAAQGSNIPTNTTIADYLNQLDPSIQYFNLAKASANPLTFFSIFVQILPLKPKLLIIPLTTDVFPKKIITTADFIVWKEKVRPILAPDVWNRYNKRGKQRFYPDIWLESVFGPSIANPISLHMYSLFWQLRHDILGNRSVLDPGQLQGISVEEALHPANESADLFRSLILEAQKNDIKTMLYIEPHAYSKQVFGSDSALVPFINFAQKLGAELNTPVFNHVDLLPPSDEYFIDYIHLTPEGNKRVATQILSDIKNSRFFTR